VTLQGRPGCWQPERWYLPGCEEGELHQAIGYPAYWGVGPKEEETFKSEKKKRYTGCSGGEVRPGWARPCAS